MSLEINPDRLSEQLQKVRDQITDTGFAEKDISFYVVDKPQELAEITSFFPNAEIVSDNPEGLEIREPQIYGEKRL